MCSLSSETQKPGDLQTNIMRQEDKSAALRGQRAEQRIKQIKHCVHTGTQPAIIHTATLHPHTTILLHATGQLTSN